jgi:hypothetical protein
MAVELGLALKKRNRKLVARFLVAGMTGKTRGKP